MALVSINENLSSNGIVKKDKEEKSTPDLKCNGIIFSKALKSALNGEKITVLKLNDLKLVDLPEELPDLFNLYEINLSGNQLQQLPPKLISAKKLRILDLSKNQFSSLPDCLMDFRTLKLLNLSENFLSDFNKPPACLPLLKELYLAHNLIEVFPQWILFDYVYSLDIIDLSFNPCFNVWKDFKEPAKNRISGVLRTLSIRNSNFTIVSSGLLLYFPALISLDISNCRNGTTSHKNTLSHLDLKYLPDNLQELHLQDVGLSSSPKIASLKNLKLLDISSNLLYWWPSEDSFAPNLQHINLTNTLLINLPDCIGKLTFLTQLMLSENEITSLPSSFGLLINLEVLDLYNNAMDSMPDLTSHTKLQCLDVWMNHFEPPLRPLGDEGPSYEDMKNTLRKNFGYHRRCDNAKERLEECDYSERSSSSFGTSPDRYTAIMPEIPITNIQKEPEEEDWDEQGDSDDCFNPEATVQTQYGTIDQEIQNIDFGKNSLKYCPPEIQHSPHLFQPYLERTNSEFWKQRRSLMETLCSSSVVDGQFDDA